MNRAEREVARGKDCLYYRQMKTCTLCKSERDESHFWMVRGKMRGYCKPCDTDRRHKLEAKRPGYHAAKTAKNMDKKRAWLIEQKQKPCTDCGVQYPFYIMEFDHRERGEKQFTIGAGRGLGFDRLKDEVAKCDVVCANCHRARTYEQKAWLIPQRSLA